jgi:lipopolysaccharide transport system permease protein
MSIFFQAAWRFRYFIAASIRGELKGRFKRSSLGGLWFILNPLAQAAIFTLILAEVLGAKLGTTDYKAAYPIYMMSGLAAWGLFSEIINRSLTIFTDNASVLKKISFPRICLPIIVWGGALVNHVLLLVAMMVVFIFFGKLPGAAVLSVALGIVLISLFAFGIGVICGVLNVFSRDVAQVVTVMLQLWFWLTPIVYPANVVPAALAPYLSLNPMVALVQIYQDAFVFDRWPSANGLYLPALLALSLSALAFIFFRRASPELVDAL